MRQTKTKPCPSCHTGRIMTDELHRQFNGKANDGKQVCADCIIQEIYSKFGGSNG